MKRTRPWFGLLVWGAAYGCGALGMWTLAVMPRIEGSWIRWGPFALTVFASLWLFTWWMDRMENS